MPVMSPAGRSPGPGRLVRHAACLLAAITLAGAGDRVRADDGEPAVDPRGVEIFVGLRDLLVHRCAGCHGAGSTEGGLDLSTREKLLAGGDRGAALVPGDGAGSLLYRLAARLEEPHMPEEGAALAADELARLREWIDRGAPFDKPLVTDAARGPWTTRSIDPAARDAWPFRPLAPVPVPGVDGAPGPADAEGWCRTPIDRFILAKLAEAGLRPAPEADRRTLLRRLSFDLTGLPAAPGEIRAFVHDADPQAWSRVVEERLARPSFGERMAQDWLDVARYAESFGYEQDYDRPHAFHYRDFVIGALNDDLPYDTFLRWQLAGDELAPDNQAARMATGFLAAGAFPTQLTEKEFESARSAEIDDMVSTVGTAMLGLTIGCARCHDHKFDPVPQADYYRLAATFTSTIRANVEIAVAPERHEAALRSWKAELDAAVAARRRIETEELPARFEAWLAGWDPAAAGAAPTWRLGRVVEASRQGAAGFEPLADGSLRALGGATDADTYTFRIDVPLDEIASLRLDALADPALPRGGPGRVEHGNFALSSIVVAAAPLGAAGESSAPAAPVRIGAGRADYSQPGLDVAAAFDDHPTSGWAIDPHVGTPHVAVFDFAEPVRHPGGSRLTVTMDFRTNVRHAIGRPRLSFSSRAGQPAVPPTADADPVGAGDAARIGEMLARGTRTGAEEAELRRLQPRFDADWLAADARVRAIERTRPVPETVTALVAGDGLKPIPHHADDRGYPHAYPETFFLRRGDVKLREGVAAPGVLQVLLRAPEGIDRFGTTPAEGTPGRRAALARWITDIDGGAGALAARVIVNRLWQHHFGRGLVATPSDFGAQGGSPSHPELLEFLAGELVRGGWRLKPLHRMIVDSAVWRQAGAGDGRGPVVDPGNRLLGRFERRRLDAEAIRDTLLAISGTLDTTTGGRAGADDTSPRRSIYLDVKRSRPSPFLRAFDAPDRVTGQGTRAVTTTAPQGLLLMNAPAVRAWAERFAARVIAEPFSFDPAAADSSPVVTAYARALGRAPTLDELADARGFLDGQTARYRADGRADAASVALADFCQVLLGLNETLFLE